MTSSSCPHCSQPIQPGFRVCPYCTAPLTTESADLPLVLPAEVDGRRDLGRIGVGLIVTGLLGFVAVILAISHGGPSDPGMILTIGGGTILLVIAGTVMAAVGNKRGSLATGLLGGIASALMGVVLGGVLIVAMIIYALNDCFKACSPPPQAQQQRR